MQIQSTLLTVKHNGFSIKWGISDQEMEINIWEMRNHYKIPKMFP